MTVCLLRGKLNPLTRTWEFPKGLTMISFMNMWFMGNGKENIPPLQYLTIPNVEYIKNRPSNLEK